MVNALKNYDRLSTKKHRDYAKPFRLFLSRTNEKDVLVFQILKCCRISKTSRILDIGAGDGSLAVKLRPYVQRYVAVEPNPLLAKRLRSMDVEIVNSSWQNASVDGLFDLILAVHVLTYFPKNQFFTLIEKMRNKLAPGGRLVILSVDQNRGSWRAIHTFLYELLGIKKRHTSELLIKKLKRHSIAFRRFNTDVRAATIPEMIKILEFDFQDYPARFKRSVSILARHLKKYQRGGAVTLSIVHQMMVIDNKSI